ncbi:uncharacterized protein EI90DRAFT_3019067 [Cantharellus anzutake]|uniref:uncharacterized protein n=1 Tax=Cantharellus anzutake TaxID=1750568 RepID=UPI001904A11B|nr:uncharacterized protein EI90DRAFT_3019067 [Cantharellus anzutake]KAF8325423.1 hypothetical protein EI90DRAFT_3019067 [Cantharellus anzutake]
MTRSASLHLTIWIGVVPASLSGNDGVVVVSKCRELLEEYNIADVDVEIRESVVTRWGSWDSLKHDFYCLEADGGRIESSVSRIRGRREDSALAKWEWRGTPDQYGKSLRRLGDPYMVVMVTK